jgi:hypothetical protein
VIGVPVWDQRERLLLVAAIGDPGDAEVAYERWRASVDLQELEGAAIRVLPLLAERAELVADHPVNRQIAKVVRFSWLKSQLLLTRLLPSIEALREADVPVMLTKGAAVVQHTHGKLHLRPMNDLDVAVPRGKAGRAAALLVRLGLEAPAMPARTRGAPILQHVHALAFTDPESQAELDLHWQVLHGSLHRDASTEFWARASEGDLRGTPVKVLAREDTLVQVIAHGQRWNIERPLVWVTDAALLLRDRTDVEWELVADVAGRHRVAAVVAEGLAGLRELAPSLLPERLPGALRPSRRRPATSARRAHWEEFVRRTVAPGRLPRPADALDYARESWAFEGARELPGLARWWAGGRRGPLTFGVTLPRDVAALRPGHRVTFTAFGNGGALLGPGWWAPDDFGAWSRGRECELTVPLDGLCAPLAELQVGVVPLVGGPVPEQLVDVYLDGARVARWRFRDPEEFTRVVEVPVPSEGTVARLRFAVGTRISQMAAGTMADHRPTGFALRFVIVGRVVTRPPWDPEVAAPSH